MPTLKTIVYSTLLFLGITIGLSVFADVAYIYTLCGLSGWAAFGHLITLDDDMPGEWSNPERSRTIWRNSLAILAVKFAVFVGLMILALSVPTLSKYGA